MQKPPVSVGIGAMPAGHPFGAVSFGAGPTSVLFDLFGAGLSDAVFISLPSLEGAASSANAPKSRQSETPLARPERAHFDIERRSIRTADERQNRCDQGLCTATYQRRISNVTTLDFTAGSAT